MYHRMMSASHILLLTEHASVLHESEQRATRRIRKAMMQARQPQCAVRFAPSHVDLMKLYCCVSVVILYSM